MPRSDLILRWQWGSDFSGGMAEWSKAAVLKTVDRKVRGFESYSLRQIEKLWGEVRELAETSRLLSG